MVHLSHPFQAPPPFYWPLNSHFNGGTHYHHKILVHAQYRVKMHCCVGEVMSFSTYIASYLPQINFI